MHGDDPAFFVVPADRALVAQYLFLYSLSGDPDDFDNYTDNDYRRALVWAFVKNDSTAYVEDLYARAASVLAEFPKGVSVRLGGSLAEQAAINGDGPGPDEGLLAEYARADELVLSKVRQQIGLDEVKWSVSGAAPTPRPEMPG